MLGKYSMIYSYKSPSTQSLPSIPHLPMRFNLNVSRGIKSSAVEAESRHRRKKFPSTQDEEIRKWRELRHQNMMRRRKRLEELAHSDPEYAKALDTKECMLEVQGILVGKLAAEENHFKGLAVLPGFCITDFEERAKEVGEVIQALQY